jgi:hypothetical protein
MCCSAEAISTLPSMQVADRSDQVCSSRRTRWLNTRGPRAIPGSAAE